jgi:serine/threonine protein kinase
MGPNTEPPTSGTPEDPASGTGTTPPTSDGGSPWDVSSSSSPAPVGPTASELGIGPTMTADRGGRPDEEPTLAYCPHPAPNFRVSGFEILGEIGRGGMGVVYKARQLSLNRLVALKALPPAFANDPARLQRFRQEAEVAARLTDARIVPIYDVLEADGVPILVMPFVDGSDLVRLLAERKRRLKERAAEGRSLSGGLGDRSQLESLLSLLDQVVEAVAAVHEAGVLHRDIKPSNLLVDVRGQVRLTDFGLARLSASTPT